VSSLRTLKVRASVQSLDFNAKSLWETKLPGRLCSREITNDSRGRWSITNDSQESESKAGNLDARLFSTS
jgi:hypothetical protein